MIIVKSGYNPGSLFPLARSRWRRTLAAACVPYLFLSMFVDFVHVHPLGASGSGAAYQVVVGPHSSKTPEGPCAVCQWLRADTGLHTPITAGMAAELLATDMVTRTLDWHAQTVVSSREFRGPPSILSA
ncbi:MAG: hypothetical protein ACRD1V_21840 [Vicinamibacterales bacterium]